MKTGREERTEREVTRNKREIVEREKSRLEEVWREGRERMTEVSNRMYGEGKREKKGKRSDRE